MINTITCRMSGWLIAKDNPEPKLQYDRFTTFIVNRSSKTSSAVTINGNINVEDRPCERNSANVLFRYLVPLKDFYVIGCVTVVYFYDSLRNKWRISVFFQPTKPY